MVGKISDKIQAVLNQRHLIMSVFSLIERVRDDIDGKSQNFDRIAYLEAQLEASEARNKKLLGLLEKLLDKNQAKEVPR